VRDRESGGTARVRALFVAASLDVGGFQRQWAGLIPLLRERGVEPSVLTLLGRGAFFDELLVRGEDVHCAELRSRFDVRGVRRVVAAERAIDVVVSQSLAGQVVGHLVARRAGAPHVTTEHLGPTLGRRPHERAALRALAPLIDLTIAVTPAQIPDLVAAGYRRSRIRVIPNGVPELAPARPAAVVRGELDIAEDSFVVVLAARLEPLKQADLFVEAVVRAHRMDDRIRGLVVGSGSEFPRIESLARGTGGVVRTVGERTDVVDLLAMADVVGLSSESEALPMVVLEAMALGRPVVATAVGGVPDVLADGAAGVLVQPGDAGAFADALVQLAHDPPRAAELGRAGHREWVQRYSADRMADAYADVLASMASAGGLQPRSEVAVDASRETSVV